MEHIIQISVFLENKSGRLAEVLGSLGQEKVKINALTIADTSEYGILRLIVNNSQHAIKILKAKEFTVTTTEIIALSVSNEAGSFASVLKVLADKNLSIEYMYAFKWSTDAILILRPENIEKSLSVLKENNFQILTAKDLDGI